MLKKIITSSLLIAAATSLANAALTLEAQYVLGEVGWNTDQVVHSKANSLVDATGNKHNLVNWGGNTFTELSPKTTIPGSDSTSSLKLSYTGAGGWSTEKDATNSASFGTNPSSDANANTGLSKYIIRFDIKLETLVQTRNSTYSYLFSNGYDADNTGLALTMTSSGQLVLGKNKAAGDEGATKKTVSGAISADTWTRLLVYVDGNNVELYKSTDGETATNLATVTNTTAALNKLKFLAGAGYPGLTGDNNYVDDLRVYSFAEGDNKASIIAAAIPEPSMFGLLAGLGALALVGARRRRK